MGGELTGDSLSLHRQLLDAVGQAAIAMDLTGTIVYWNSAAELMYGWSAAEAIGQPLGALLVDEGDAPAGAEIVRTVLAGEIWTGQSTVRRKNGTSFPVLVTDSPVLGPDGDVIGIIGVSVDVSEYNATTQALQLREAQYRSRFTDSSLPQAALDLDGLMTAVNPAMCRWLGYCEQDLLGRPPDMLLVPEDRPQLVSDQELLLTDPGQSVLDSVRHFRRRDGQVLCGLTSVMLVKDDQGALCQFAVFVQDLTARLAAEEALRASEAGLLARFEQSSVPQLTLDGSRHVTAVNAAFCGLLGGTPELVLGRPADGLLRWEGDNQQRREVDRVFAGERDACRVESTLRTVEGADVSLLVHLTLQRAPDGTPAGVECHAQDLTTLRNAQALIRRRDVMMSALAANASDIALVVDLGGSVRYVSPSAGLILTVAVGDVVDMVELSTVHPDDRAAVRQMTTEVCATLGASATMTYRSIDQLGQWRWVEQVVTNRLDDDDIGGLVLNLRDVHERVEAERALRDSEARYRLIAETAQEGIVTTDREGRILYANRRMAELLGRPLEELYGHSSSGLASQKVGAMVRDRTSRRHLIGPEQYEVAQEDPQGVRRILHVSASPLPGVNGRPSGSLAMVTDVTAAREAEDELRRRALHDTLTGLPNRALLLDRLEPALDRHLREQRPVSVLLVDLDQFKLVNDCLGHAAGDALLVTLGERMVACVRPGDTVARSSGDEFLVLCPDVDEAQAQQLASRLLATVCTPVEVAGRTITVTASIGVAVTPVSDAETLLGHAYTAMYAAKSRGRARSAVFDAALAHRARHELELSNDLRSALAADELTLYYQPVVDLVTGRAIGVEALCRWKHPEHGFVPPVEFITVAEQTGLIEELDHWVIRRACTDAVAMRQAGVLPLSAYVAINLSARNLGDGTLEFVLRQAAESAGLPFDALVLEVTESGVMDDPEKAQFLLENLRSLGASIAIDDFGTGYSSLAYLRKFPVSTLKIDRSFVTNIVDDSDNLAIVAAIIDLARALNLTTVAEGIETPSDLALLGELGCTAGQGYLWSPAVPTDQLGAVLQPLLPSLPPSLPQMLPAQSDRARRTRATSTGTSTARS